jgi:hypothetical protein
MVVDRASLRSGAFERVTVMMPSASVVTVATYLDC